MTSLVQIDYELLYPEEIRVFRTTESKNNVFRFFSFKTIAVDDGIFFIPSNNYYFIQ